MSTVNKHKKHYKKNFNSGNSPEAYDITSDHHDHDIVARVQELVNMDPSKSMRAMVCKLEVSATLVCKIIKEDLRYKSFGLRKGQFMSKAKKLQRWEKANKLLSCLKHQPKWRFGPLEVQSATPLTIMSGAAGDVNKAPHNTKESLIMKIMEVFTN